MAFGGGVPGLSNWEETPGQTQDALERLHFPTVYHKEHLEIPN